MKDELSKYEKNEEAHGLWELAVVRLAALAEAEAPRAKISEAVKAERDAFNHWQRVSRKLTS